MEGSHPFGAVQRMLLLWSRAKNRRNKLNIPTRVPKKGVGPRFRSWVEPHLPLPLCCISRNLGILDGEAVQDLGS